MFLTQRTRVSMAIYRLFKAVLQQVNENVIDSSIL